MCFFLISFLSAVLVSSLAVGGNDFGVDQNGFDIQFHAMNGLSKRTTCSASSPCANGMPQTVLLECITQTN